MAVMALCREAHTSLVRPDSARGEVVAVTIIRWRSEIVIAYPIVSVITCEALWADPELSVDRLITPGSPLGRHNVVVDRVVLAPAHRGFWPLGVRSRENLADIRDIFAVPKEFSGCFDWIDRHAADPHIAERDFHTARDYPRCSTGTAIVHSGWTEIEGGPGRAVERVATDASIRLFV